MSDDSQGDEQGGEIPTCDECGKPAKYIHGKEIKWPEPRVYLGGEIAEGPPQSTIFTLECEDGHIFTHEVFFQ